MNVLWNGSPLYNKDTKVQASQQYPEFNFMIGGGIATPIIYNGNYEFKFVGSGGSQERTGTVMCV